MRESEVVLMMEDRAEEALEDVLDSVKTARYQIDTLSHVSDDLAGFVEGLGDWTERLEAFLTDPSRAAVVAASVITLIVLIGYLRARLALFTRAFRKRYSIF